MERSNVIQIELAKFKEDPADGYALELAFEVKGDGRPYQMVPVYFSDEFVEGYFEIPWSRLAEDESRILHQNKERFIRWALLKIEQHLLANQEMNKIYLDLETDGSWAREVDQGTVPQYSVRQSEGIYFFQPDRQNKAA